MGGAISELTLPNARDESLALFGHVVDLVATFRDKTTALMLDQFVHWQLVDRSN